MLLCHDARPIRGGVQNDHFVSGPEVKHFDSDQESLAIIVNNADHRPPKLSGFADFVQASRRDLYRLRRDIGQHVNRVKPCGAYPRDKNGLVTVAQGGERKSVFYTDLQHCNSIWACPICSLKISQERAEDVNLMLTNAILVDGYHGQFVTLTIPHGVFENLKTLQEIVSEGFRTLTSHPDYKGRHRKGELIPGIKQRYGVQGYIRALEVKKKNRGWHPHLHIAFVLDKMEAERLADFSSDIISLWAKIIKSSSGKTIDTEYGQASTPITDIKGISDYANKWNIGNELTQSHKKIASDSMTPFELFGHYKRTGNETYLNHFKHYVLSFHGVKQLTFSSGFKKAFLRGKKEKTDAEACKAPVEKVILLAMGKDLFKELYNARVEADFLNLMQFNKDEAIDFLFHYFPDVKYNTDSDYPIFKLERKK